MVSVNIWRFGLVVGVAKRSIFFRGGYRQVLNFSTRLAFYIYDATGNVGTDANAAERYNSRSAEPFDTKLTIIA